MEGTRCRQDFAGALLAGGRSLRMGEDKARLRDETGRELRVRQAELLQDLTGGEVMISCRDDQDYGPAAGIPVRDEWPDAGPLGGVVCCLEWTTADRLLVLAVDLPAMRREVLQRLMHAALEAGEETGAVYRREGFLEPLAAVYPVAMAVSGRRRVLAGELALKDWIAEEAARMQVVDLPAEWSAAFLNMNHPEEWARWRGRTTGKT